MPIYSYICKKCCQKFDRLVGMTRIEEELLCPSCGSRDLDRVLTTFRISSRERKTSSNSNPALSCRTCPGGDCSTCR